MRRIDAQSLKNLYEAQLEHAAEAAAGVGGGTGEAAGLLAASRRSGAGALHEHLHSGRIWIWSDLHLDDAEAVNAFGRPFDSPWTMAGHLFEQWRRRLGADDTMIILGDVAGGDPVPETASRIRDCPSWKLLVVGDHDESAGGGPRADAYNAFDEIHSTLYTPGDPPLLMTHAPLAEVPAGCVNVHGHTHHRTAEGPGHRINVCVEQIGYTPRPLHAVRALAAHLAAGRRVWGATTADQLAEIGGGAG